MNETEKLTEIDLAEMAKKAPVRDAYSSVVDFALLIDRLGFCFASAHVAVEADEASMTVFFKRGGET